MKLTEHFADFLRSTVNLNQSRIDQLEQRVETIGSFIRRSNYAPRIYRFSAQGSWAHRTIIKPQDRDFDADLLAIVNVVKGWQAADYINELYHAFRGNKVYADKVSRGTRCVELNYAGDFHLDIVPCIQVIEGECKRFWVCNRLEEDGFEETASEAYTEWLAEKNRIVGKNQLCKVIRLLKYLRDIKETFSAKSILLTTLVGMQISNDDGIFNLVKADYFSSLPASLKTIIHRLDDFLQARPSMPTIENPVLAGEHFNRHWNQDKYENFRSKIHQYRQWIDDAYAESDRDESIRKWRRVFGDEFAKGEVVKKAASVPAVALREGASSRELVGAIKSFGISVLKKIPFNLPYIEKAPWRFNKRKISVIVRASEYTQKNGDFICKLESGTIIPKNRSIRFEIYPQGGLPSTFFVRWRVVNTGEEAVEANGLRGDFYQGDSDTVRWESTLYTGVHWVEAFVINQRTNACVGKSDRFFVVIE